MIKSELGSTCHGLQNLATSGLSFCHPFLVLQLPSYALAWLVFFQFLISTSLFPAPGPLHMLSSYWGHSCSDSLPDRLYSSFGIHLPVTLERGLLCLPHSKTGLMSSSSSLCLFSSFIFSSTHTFCLLVCLVSVFTFELWTSWWQKLFSCSL